MVTLRLLVVYKQVKIRKNTDEILDDCVKEYLRHHPEMRNIPISRDKIIYEISIHYLKVW